MILKQPVRNCESMWQCLRIMWDGTRHDQRNSIRESREADADESATKWNNSNKRKLSKYLKVSPQWTCLVRNPTTQVGASPAIVIVCCNNEFIK